jgi:hypothetical protein
MRIFNRVQPVHKAVTGFGAMAYAGLRGNTAMPGFRRFISGILWLFAVFAGPLWNVHI